MMIIATTGDRFSDFAPYVASINSAGTVAFQARLRAGGTGVFAGNGDAINTIAETTDSHFGEFYSHPDIDSSGDLSVYASLKWGRQGVVLFQDGQHILLADTEFSSIGPLGPTMNDAGTIAFRADTKSGASGVFTTRQGSILPIATTGDRLEGFQGLPVISQRGSVVFRADLPGGGQGIYLNQDGSLTTIAETGAHYHELGRFPVIDDTDRVAFVATLTCGDSDIFSVSAGETSQLMDTHGLFESFRGVLIASAGIVVFYAIPREGTFKGKMGIYSGADPTAPPILSEGTSIYGSTVTGFALNPVSANTLGQVAVRVVLADGRQMILRIDPTY